MDLHDSNLNSSPEPTPSLSPQNMLARYRRALKHRQPWQSHWHECYEFALPRRQGDLAAAQPGAKLYDRLFDGTAPDAVEQLAASLLSELTPPWGQWFGLVAGPDLEAADADELAGEFERISRILKSNFDRSNFVVEMHQCYLDLVTAGTASLLLEETGSGEQSAFRFTAIPLSQLVLEESPSGRLDTTYRRSDLTRSQIIARFPSAQLPDSAKAPDTVEEEHTYAVIEAVIPNATGRYQYLAVLQSDHSNTAPVQLAEGIFRHSPFINFRWLKAPGEIYGRSPVMKALPDIKTANKVVELILKNASIAVTGIWQADDDGVLNPANIRLVPGTIIPKAVGSAGLTPLQAPGRFDISELVLDRLRQGIRRALLADKLGQVDAPRMSATEVLERSAEMARLLGATYGRLQAELLMPLVSRSMAILKRRGEIEDITIDGRIIDLEYRSPLARQNARREASGVLQWLETLKALGPEALGAVDNDATARWLANAFSVPGELLVKATTGFGPTFGDDLIEELATTLDQLTEPPKPETRHEQ